MIFSSFCCSGRGQRAREIGLFVGITLIDPSDRLALAGVVEVDSFTGGFLSLGFSFGGILMEGNGAPQPGLADFGFLITQMAI